MLLMLEGEDLCCVTLDKNIAALLLLLEAAGPNNMAGQPLSSSDGQKCLPLLTSCIHSSLAGSGRNSAS